MKNRAGDYLILDEAAGVWREDPEQAVRDDVEKHYWLHVGRTIMKDWRLYLMLVPMLLVFLFWRYMPMYELLGSFNPCSREHHISSVMDSQDNLTSPLQTEITNKNILSRLPGGFLPA